MRVLLPFSLVALLAACGANGAPQPPTEPGVTITGEAQFGVVGKL